MTPAGNAPVDLVASVAAQDMDEESRVGIYRHRQLDGGTSSPRLLLPTPATEIAASALAQLTGGVSMADNDLGVVNAAGEQPPSFEATLLEGLDFDAFENDLAQFLRGGAQETSDLSLGFNGVGGDGVTVGLW